jgi:flavin reductase (DIM6/NTAB) family NADH-FMN oxidoreductase RutF
MHFAKNANDFDVDRWHLSNDKPPISKSALASFECELEVTYDGGDHTIVVGRVKQYSQRTGNPLIFSAGEFGTFQESNISK